MAVVAIINGKASCLQVKIGNCRVGGRIYEHRVLEQAVRTNEVGLCAAEINIVIVDNICGIC